MSKYPSVTGKRLIKALLRRGYKKLRQNGSHVSIGHPMNPLLFTVVQDTPKDLLPGTRDAIRRNLRLTRKKYLEILSDC